MFTCMAETFVVVRCALFIELINLILWQIDHVRHIAHPIRKQLLSELQLLFDDTFKFVEEQFAGVIRSLVLQVIGERQSEAVMREHSWTSKRAITFVGISAKLDPIVTPKIDSFSSIWPIAESSVKGSRKGYNILPFVLHKLAHWDICVLQKTRTEHCRNVVKKIRDISHFHGEIALEHFLQTVSRFFVTRYTVPLLWSASVVIVHTVKIVIFIMVRKGCEQGSVIHPRNIDPIDTNFDVTEYRSGSSGHIIKIPVGFLVVCCKKRFRWVGVSSHDWMVRSCCRSSVIYLHSGVPNSGSGAFTFSSSKVPFTARPRCDKGKAEPNWAESTSFPYSTVTWRVCVSTMSQKSRSRFSGRNLFLLWLLLLFLFSETPVFSKLSTCLERRSWSG
mmetsp:Transcript_36375/g.75711  ORF Transcript_36375/g.75711 Transcript_36375/m.75711 type:complete len:390 (+) Transcript_36375:354-1523(+)